MLFFKLPKKFAFIASLALFDYLLYPLVPFSSLITYFSVQLSNFSIIHKFLPNLAKTEFLNINFFLRFQKISYFKVFIFGFTLFLISRFVKKYLNHMSLEVRIKSNWLPTCPRYCGKRMIYQVLKRSNAILQNFFLCPSKTLLFQGLLFNWEISFLTFLVLAF